MALDGKKSFYPPHTLNLCDPEAPVFVFTDGACEPADDGSYVALVGGVLICGNTAVFRWTSRWVVHEQVDGWQEAYIIGLVELDKSFWRDIIGIKGRVVFFVDNIPSMRSLVKGTSSERQWRKLLRSLESIEMKGPTYSWFARVPSDSNIADGPSRDDYSGLELFEATIPVCIIAQSLVQW
jgi:hypothetical protein